MKTKAEIEAGLTQFTGTENWHRFNSLYKHHLVTDGVKWLCENAECWWLPEAIASHHSTAMKDQMLQEMQFWTLRVNRNPEPEPAPMTVGAVLKHKKAAKPAPMAILTCYRDEGDMAITQEIPLTDFPLDEIKLWCAPSGNGKDFTIFLPSEY